MHIKIVLALFFVGLCLDSLSQQFVVTPEGLRNAADTSKKYVVIEAPSMSEKKLYDNALKFIQENYADPDSAIKLKWDSTVLTFDTYVRDFLVYNNTGALIGIEALYTTELRFYDGSVRMEITALDMKGQDSNYRLLFKGKWLKSYIVYKNNGKLFKPKTKEDIENYFNSEIDVISRYLKQK